MSVVVSCICGRQFQADAQLYGKQVSCPSCGAVINVPDAGQGLTGLTPINPPTATASSPSQTSPYAANPYGQQSYDA